MLSGKLTEGEGALREAGPFASPQSCCGCPEHLVAGPSALLREGRGKSRAPISRRGKALGLARAHSTTPDGHGCHLPEGAPSWPPQSPARPAKGRSAHRLTPKAGGGSGRRPFGEASPSRSRCGARHRKGSCGPKRRWRLERHSWTSWPLPAKGGSRFLSAWEGVPPPLPEAQALLPTKPPPVGGGSAGPPSLLPAGCSFFPQRPALQSDHGKHTPCCPSLPKT